MLETPPIRLNCHICAVKSFLSMYSTQGLVWGCCVSLCGLWKMWHLPRDRWCALIYVVCGCCEQSCPVLCCADRASCQPCGVILLHCGSAVKVLGNIRLTFWHHCPGVLRGSPVQRAGEHDLQGFWDQVRQHWGTHMNFQMCERKTGSNHSPGLLWVGQEVIWLRMMQESLAFYQERLSQDSVGKNVWNSGTDWEGDYGVPTAGDFFCEQDGWQFVSNGKYSGVCLKAEWRIKDS